ncbi:MAG: Lysine--tRNA ligase [Patescibacteria group bacterium]|nr:lysine--tRNA ligase [Candidatus Saccharibacteria bacterium]MDQ5963587.1 Lysine--tRNA ligase [Patescibacteria group bacterium]
MQWLNKIVDELIARHPSGVITVSSGVSPSGTYHLGTLREVLTAEIIAVELRRRGREAQHLHIVDDLDVFRKVPANIPAKWEKYLGLPLADIPAPNGSGNSYADFFLQDLLDAATEMNLTMETVRAHEKYRSGYFVPAIERALENVPAIRTVLEEVSGRKLNDQWTPIQIIEDGYVKSRQFVSIDTGTKTVTYINKHDQEAMANYADGHVTMSWRVDWPARWWMLGVNGEPFGRDHATKGGSYDTGVRIAREVFGSEPPLPVPYNFINRVGDTKKMSKSAGNVITAKELLTILPPEIVWFFLLRSSPDKQLFFGEGETLLRLFDDFAALQAKADRSEDEQHLLDLCLQSVTQPVVSNVPFSHLVASYQAALKDPAKTLAIIERTEYAETARNQAETITRELAFIDNWLKQWAPDEVKFSLVEQIQTSDFTENEIKLFTNLAQKIADAPHDADGTWFHQAIYEQKDVLGMQPKEMFGALYRLIINKSSGPRAGWFLSILPRDWLLVRLRLVK